MEESQILSNTCVETSRTASDSFQGNDFDQTYVITDLSNSSQRLVSIPSEQGFHSNLLDQTKQSFVANTQDHVYDIPIVSHEIVINNLQTNFIDSTKELPNPVSTDNTNSFSVVDTSSVAPADEYVSNVPGVNNITNENGIEKLKGEIENPSTNAQQGQQIQKKVFKLPFPIPKGLKKIKNLIAIYHCKICGFMSKSKELMDEHGKTHKTVNEPKPQVQKPRRKRRTKKEMAMKRERNAKGPKKGNDKDQLVKKGKAVRKVKSEVKGGPVQPEDDVIIKNGNVYCPQCSFFTKNLQSLKVHRLMHLKERPYKCTVCDYHGKDLKDLIRHHDGGHLPGIFVCKDCGYLTNERSRFDNHRETHIGHLPYRCKVCPYKTMLKAAHRIHMETHGIQV